MHAFLKRSLVYSSRALANDSANQISQVLRYSAFFGGIGYGFTHQRSIYKKDGIHKAEEEEKHQESLIQKAKQEWERKLNPPAPTIGGP